MPDKNAIARSLAEAHHREQTTITQIVRLLGPREIEANEPIKLLEVNPTTSPSGVWPIAFTPDPPEVPFGSVVVEVTPTEYDDILANRLRLPDGWTLGEKLFPIGG